MKFTVIIPTFSNGPVIRNAIESVRAQSATDLELFLISDGAPAETLTIMDEYCALDRRIRAFKFEKGARHGEAWRHVALQQADSEAVCYLSDDDFWFDNHLQVMNDFLGSCDFAHTRLINVMPDFTINGFARDLADENIRARLLVERCNFVGLSVVGHRLDAYRTLPEGWGPAPPDIATDFHMWRKWWARKELSFHSSSSITSLHMPRIYRRQQSAAACEAETGLWRRLFEDEFMRAALREMAPADETFLPIHAIIGRGWQLRSQAS